MSLPPLPPSSPHGWPLVVYLLDLVSCLGFALVVVVSIAVLVSIMMHRVYFFNVFWGMKIIQCAMATIWACSLFAGEVCCVWGRRHMQGRTGIPGYPRNPSLAPLPLFSTMCHALPPFRWLFDLYFARVRSSAGSMEPAKPCSDYNVHTHS